MNSPAKKGKNAVVYRNHSRPAVIFPDPHSRSPSNFNACPLAKLRANRNAGSVSVMPTRSGIAGVLKIQKIGQPQHSRRTDCASSDIT